MGGVDFVRNAYYTEGKRRATRTIFSLRNNQDMNHFTMFHVEHSSNHSIKIPLSKNRKKKTTNDSIVYQGSKAIGNCQKR